MSTPNTPNTPNQRLTRRTFLAGLGAASAAVPIRAASASAATTTPAAAASPLSSQATDPSDPVLDLDQIQGNVLAGFNKDHQAFVFVRFGSVAAARAWLGELRPNVATTRMVAAFNGAFRAAVASTGDESAAPAATWVNVAFSHAGLRALGVSRSELDSFPEEFRAGMRNRANVVGDTGPNASSTWPTPYRSQFHAVVLVAADLPADLTAAVDVQRGLAARHGVTVAHVEFGETRVDEPGHEHFGFRDGISQPGVRGFTARQNPDNPDQGVPGQDLIWPGEFVLGQARQPRPGRTGAGPIAASGPAWTVNGSYLVFRRLRQDVAGFRRFVTDMARRQGMSEDLAGAKLVGRYKSGAALAVTGAKPTDAGAADASLLEPTSINDFEFGEDASGSVTPLASHIRKTYPRDTDTPDGGEADTQTHRVMRRGIPFGVSLPAGSTENPSFPNDRGLLFLCYQTSIARQFEHVQRRWVNDPDFPARNSGQDPVIAQSPATGSFTLAGGRDPHVALMQRFVTTTGGEYFLQPSLEALARLSGATATSSGAGVPPVTRSTTSSSASNAEPVPTSEAPSGGAGQLPARTPGSPAPRRRPRPRPRPQGPASNTPPDGQ